MADAPVTKYTVWYKITYSFDVFREPGNRQQALAYSSYDDLAPYVKRLNYNYEHLQDWSDIKIGSSIYIASGGFAAANFGQSHHQIYYPNGGYSGYNSYFDGHYHIYDDYVDYAMLLGTVADVYVGINSPYSGPIPQISNTLTSTIYNGPGKETVVSDSTVAKPEFQWLRGTTTDFVDADGNGFDDRGDNGKKIPPQPPSITSNGGGVSAAVTIAENTAAVTKVQATDPDVGAKLSYSISGGADAAQFQIDAVTGALVFVAAPNFEAPGDAGANNVYNVIVRVSDGQLTDEQAIAVKVVNANEAPVITSDGGGDIATRTILENTDAVTIVSATDVDARAKLVYSVGGLDAAKFIIGRTTGELRFRDAPNFEAPSDAGKDNVYDVIVRASDGKLSDEQAIAVTVTNVNEAPHFTSRGRISINENSTAVMPVHAEDQDAGTTLRYSITGGADRAKFTIDPNTGALSFIAPPDFEARGAHDADNTYDVTVGVTDNTKLWDYQDITVEIKNVNERPVIISNGGGDKAEVTILENTSAVTTVRATDPDLATLFGFAIVGGADAAKFFINGQGVLTFASPPNFEVPRDAGGNNVYNVTVRVGDGQYADDQAVTVTIINVNEFAPLITSNGGDATAAVSIAENSKAVTTVIAFDGDAGTLLRYAIVGGADAAKFSINAVTGALTFNSAPDFEAPGDVGADNVYDVTVRVGDGYWADEQAIAITVTDAFDTYTGTGEADTFTAPAGKTNWSIAGLGGDDRLTGRAGNDVIDGGAGDDILRGGPGANTLIGGPGSDTFRFTALDAGGLFDKILDYTRGAGGDHIELSKAGFAALDTIPLGALPASAFVLGAAAITADQRLIFDKTGSSLYYDADGSGAAAQIKIAVLAEVTMVSADDFVVV